MGCERDRRAAPSMRRTATPGSRRRGSERQVQAAVEAQLARDRELGGLPRGDGIGDVDRRQVRRRRAAGRSPAPGLPQASIAAAARPCRNRCRARVTNAGGPRARSPGETARVTTARPRTPAQPTKTSPTGFSGVPPPGPATPVMPSPHVGPAPASLRPRPSLWPLRLRRRRAGRGHPRRRRAAPS
jgi:hypothetical protein